MQELNLNLIQHIKYKKNNNIYNQYKNRLYNGFKQTKTAIFKNR